MDTRRKSFVLFVTGTLLYGLVAAGCGSSSGSDDPEATPTAPPRSPTPTSTRSPDPNDPDASVVARGARLFSQETFDGNGRTCGTCHPTETGFTLTPELVASRPASDPLFVAERVPELAELENPALLRGPRALILENVDGFDQPPVFRAVPHLFEVARTGPFGWSGRTSRLEDVVVQAIRQHFPRTLRRVEGVDFRLPTDDEMTALVAFLESAQLVSGADGAAPFDVMSLVRTEAQRRGADLFFGSATCFACHTPPLFMDHGSLDTGVTRRPVNVAPPPECDPPCAALGALEDRDGHRFFNTPTLLNLTHSAPYFHDNSAATIREAVAHYSTPAFNDSDGARGIPGGIHMTEQEIDDVTAFLEALSGR